MNRLSHPDTLHGGFGHAHEEHDEEPDWELLRAQAEAESFEAAAYALRAEAALTNKGTSGSVQSSWEDGDAGDEDWEAAALASHRSHAALQPSGHAINRGLVPGYDPRASAQANAPHAFQHHPSVAHVPHPFESGNEHARFDGYAPAPVFATPSLVPAPSTGGHDALSDFDDETAHPFATTGRPKWLVPAAAVLGVVMAAFAGNALFAQQAAEAERAALNERMRQEMAAAHSEAQKVEAPAPMPAVLPNAELPTTGVSVAALLSKSVASHGALGATKATVTAPRAKVAQRVKRVVSSRGRVHKPVRRVSRKAARPEEGDGIPENNSNDPLLGL